MVSLQKICAALSECYPPQCAESWDNPGLLLGRNRAEIRRVVVALELTPEVVEEAIETRAELIVTRHPFIFKPMSSLTDSSPDGRMMLDLAAAGIALYAAHTNLDSAPAAIGEKLACDLGLMDVRALLSHEPFSSYKIVVFVPHTAVDAVAKAMHEAGAGCVGHYRDVSFRGTGTGHFTGDDTTHPAIGSPNIAETVAETRLEMVVSSRDLNRTMNALRAAHPYEEPAFDVFKLENDVAGIADLYGFGTIGRLPSPIHLCDLLNKIKEIWEIQALRVADLPLDKVIEKVAILNGSGSKYAKKCAQLGADAYITGDCGHHDFDLARRYGLALIDAGHYDTEKFIPEILRSTINRLFANDVEVSIAKSMKNPMIFYPPLSMNGDGE